MNELLVGYARVSAEQQDLTAQRNRLHVLAVGDDRIYVDHGLTGTNRDRPGLRLGLARTVAARRWCYPRQAHEEKHQAQLRRLDP
jgi:hypothetical protein